MKNLTDWFSRVYVINCAHRPDRLEEVTKHLQETGMADMDKVVIYPAIIGDWVTHPADWRAGNGSWGCLRSHMRILEDAMQERDMEQEGWPMTLENILILEDDVFFLENALEDLNRFMNIVPSGWGQLYLGGQHQRKPVLTAEGVLVGLSVNRTHAYAVSRDNFQPLYRHICYASDYIGKKRHIDHQLELAHQRRDWDVYCPERWICGQRAGTSNISGRKDTERIWMSSHQSAADQK
jgi:GR25 family glycosyltransferase involved in LPS biosynthesis